MHNSSPYPSLPAADDGRVSIASLLQELRAETLRLALPAVAAAGLALIVLAARARDPLHIALPGLALFLLAGLTWTLDRYRHTLAVWTLAAARAPPHPTPGGD